MRPALVLMCHDKKSDRDQGDTQDVRSVQQFNQLMNQLDARLPATLLIRRANIRPE